MNKSYITRLYMNIIWPESVENKLKPVIIKMKWAWFLKYINSGKNNYS